MKTGTVISLATIPLIIGVVVMTALVSGEPARQDAGTGLLSSSPNDMTYASWMKANSDFVKPSDEILKKKLTRLQYNVTQKDDTERPYKNEYWDNKREGIYVDIVSGEPLFSSTEKYDSRTGWPSFTRPIAPDVISYHEDRSLFFIRTELRSRLADSHIGHIFEDGPPPTGLRYCINSASLRFIPKADLAREGYGEFLALFE